MIGRLLLSALAPLLILLAAGGAPAPAGAAGRRCDAAVARTATVGEIAADEDKWRGRCVAVTATSDGLMLFTGADAYYRARRLTGASVGRKDPEDPDRIGLSGERLQRRLPAGRLTQVTAIGVVDTCYDIYSRAVAGADGATIGFQGYCGLAGGPLIQLRDVRVGRAVFLTRRTDAAARAAYGDLVPAPAGWPRRALVEQRATAFLAALRARDAEAMAALHLGSFGREGGRGDAAFVLSAASPFAAVAASAAPQTAIFLDRASPETALDETGVAICFCRAGDCSDRWPIAQVDADNRNERPYACTRLDPYLAGARALEPVLVTRRTGRGLTEPRGR